MQNILFGPSSTLPCLQKQSGCQAERMVLAARYPSRWAMRPHLLRVQMHRACKEQRGQAEGRTYFETSCFRLPDCMHAQALCAVADSFAATQHRQPPVEHWRYAPLDLTCLSVLRSARCRYCSSPPAPLISVTRTSVCRRHSEVGMQECWSNFHCFYRRRGGLWCCGRRR